MCGREGGANTNDSKRAWWSVLFLFRAALSVRLAADTHEIRIISFPVYEYTRFNFSSSYCTNAQSSCLTSKKMAHINIIESLQC